MLDKDDKDDKDDDIKVLVETRFFNLMFLQNSKVGHLHLVSFPRHEIHEALDFIRQHAQITRSDDSEDQPMLYVTGMGCSEFGKTIGERLNIR
jgi:hypothetical protein